MEFTLRSIRSLEECSASIRNILFAILLPHLLMQKRILDTVLQTRIRPLVINLARRPSSHIKCLRGTCNQGQRGLLCPASLSPESSHPWLVFPTLSPSSCRPADNWPGTAQTRRGGLSGQGRGESGRKVTPSRNFPAILSSPWNIKTGFRAAKAAPVARFLSLSVM